MSRLLEWIRRPEYTGSNRCCPCTITNGALVAAAVAALALARRRLLAAAVGAVGLASIGARGYVVPYTPRFAPQLAAALSLDPHDPDEPGSLSGVPTDADSASDDDAIPGEDVLAALLEAEVVVPDGEQLRLADGFGTDWREEMRALRERDLEALAALADEHTASETEARVGSSFGRSYLVLQGEGGLVTLRREIAVAELGAARALESRVDDPAIRRAAGKPLRSLLEACPLCDGPLEITQSTCCGEVTPIGSLPAEKLFCPDCDVRLFTFDRER
ncbi:hypothetical protein [Natronococcus jeotgali]|uniref:Uncharacterized protein n=1 Tax=Natronococcus jeotgali DSM 18795 TaxID=1227498 RepID=L9XBA9_9EURY|nr:hypothetical protein [Natronococcus jeotgali]ELY57908.1 hypothetical protein C492_13339 [Natronococcus jeotgali DSM 18795]